MATYDSDFYHDRDAMTRFAAETILGIVQDVLPQIHSAIDIGCGVGTWLRVLTDRGASRVLGIDGPWVDRQALVIPPECFHTRDLSAEDLSVKGPYDLVINLEVAEHLPPHRARGFIDQLTSLGDFVLFSAAVPGQGGTGHVNEQWPEYWPEYWIELFRQRGYAFFDIVRGPIWTDTRIAVHYRQNAFLFVKEERVADLRLHGTPAGGPLAIVHPQLFLAVRRDLTNPPIRQAFGLLTRAIIRRIKRAAGLAS